MMKSLETQVFEFLKLPLAARIALPTLTFSSLFLQSIIFFRYNTSCVEFLIMFVLYYFSWKRILNPSVINKEKVIAATYLFSLLIICAAFCMIFHRYF